MCMHTHRAAPGSGPHAVRQDPLTVVRFHVTVPGVHGEHSPAVRDGGLSQVGQGPMDLLLDQRAPLVTRCGRLLADLAKPLDTLWLHGDCVSSLSVIGLSRTFIL